MNLAAGARYWLEVAPSTRHDRASWQDSDSTDTCTVDENYYGMGWSTISTTSCPAGKDRAQIAAQERGKVVAAGPVRFLRTSTHECAVLWRKRSRMV